MAPGHKAALRIFRDYGPGHKAALRIFRDYGPGHKAAFESFGIMARAIKPPSNLSGLWPGPPGAADFGFGVAARPSKTGGESRSLSGFISSRPPDPWTESDRPRRRSGRTRRTRRKERGPCRAGRFPQSGSDSFPAAPFG